MTGVAFHPGDYLRDPISTEERMLRMQALNRAYEERRREHTEAWLEAEQRRLEGQADGEAGDDG